MQEKWIRWEPIAGLEGKHVIESITDDANGFIVIFSLNNDNDFRIELACKPYAEAYRQNNAQFRLHALSSQLAQQYGDDFHHNWTFFRLVHSEYLAWLDDESGTVSSYCGMEHFCVLGKNAVIDIAVRWEPEVRIIPIS